MAVSTVYLMVLLKAGQKVEPMADLTVESTVALTDAKLAVSKG